jgi:16S rRNA (cytosine1407-C5)-methyltransferase
MRNTQKNVALIEYLTDLLADEYETFIKARQEPKAIRINILKRDVTSIKNIFDENGQSYETIPFCPDQSGLILKNDNLPLSHTLSFFRGDFQYQGISSQLPVLLLDVRKGDRVLDMCAAPGSKSAQLVAVMENRDELVLNDIAHHRLQALNVNMQRSGATNYYITKLRGETLGCYFYQYFDKVLLDVPCTALGILASNPEVGRWWSKEKLSKISGMQYELLVSAFKSLKIGGEVVYSTCSISPEENELIIQKVIKNYPLEVIQPPEFLTGLFFPGLKYYQGERLSPQLKKAIRILPHRHYYEGFFAIKLRKMDAGKSNESNLKAEWKNTLEHSDPLVKMILETISNSWGIPFKVWENYRFNVTQNRIWVVNKNITKLLYNSFVSAGLLLAERRLFDWKLVNGSVQFFAHDITKRKIELKDEQLIKLFAQGSIECSDLSAGYYALSRKGESFAAVYIGNNIMKIQLPHSFRLIFLD